MMEEIEKKIRQLKEEIEELHKERKHLIDTYGGISTEQNNDFIDDIINKDSEIKTLQWAISQIKPNEK